MQVFVPYPTPFDVARCLDAKRLLKQIIEAKQILDAIDGSSDAWKNHPVTKMYAPFREWLDRYYLCLKHYSEGDVAQSKWWSRHADPIRPDFLTDDFCDQHKRRLYTKAPKDYPQFEEFGMSEENWYFLDGAIAKYVKGKKQWP